MRLANVLFLHCLIHQDVLCKAVIDTQPVLSVVIKLINTIRSRGLMHREFQEFLKSSESEFNDLLYHTKVKKREVTRTADHVHETI